MRSIIGDVDYFIKMNCYESNFVYIPFALFIVFM